MDHNSFMDKFRVFFGLNQAPPRNDFRNPIWISDDEDDGDELYARRAVETFENTVDLHQELSKHLHEMFSSFGNMFGDFKAFWHDQDGVIDNFTSMNSLSPENPESFDSDTKTLRDYYLKPGYHNRHEQHREDVDLDGKISSHEISGLLKQNKDMTPHTSRSVVPFDGNLVQGGSFCRTIITTSVTKPDGTIETRKIVKNGNKVIEETTTSTSSSDLRGPQHGFEQMSSPGHIYSQVMSELSSLFKNVY